MFDLLKKWFGGFRSDNGGPGSGPDGEMISCREALERLYEYMDGELDGSTREQVARHLEICERCYPRLAFESSFKEAVRRATRGEAAPDHVRDRVLQVIEDEGLE